jgi:hypothetical protein
MPRHNKCGIANRKRGFEPHDTERRAGGCQRLFILGMWRVIRGYDIYSAVAQGFYHSQPVKLCAQRRVHFSVRAVSIDSLVCQREIMRRRFGCNRNAPCFCLADKHNAFFGADMLQMYMTARFVRKRDIPRHDIRFGAVWDAAKPQPARHSPFVDNAAGADIMVFRVIRYKQPKRPCAFGGTAHKTAVHQRFSVVGQCAYAAFLHLFKIGKLAPFLIHA